MFTSFFLRHLLAAGERRMRSATSCNFGSCSGASSKQTWVTSAWMPTTNQRGSPRGFLAFDRANNKQPETQRSSTEMETANVYSKAWESFSTTLVTIVIVNTCMNTNCHKFSAEIQKWSARQQQPGPAGWPNSWRDRLFSCLMVFVCQSFSRRSGVSCPREKWVAHGYAVSCVTCKSK